MPKHKHNLNFSGASFGGSGTPSVKDFAYNGGDNTRDINYAGDSNPHPNMPPYIVLYYIEKIK